MCHCCTTVRWQPRAVKTSFYLSICLHLPHVYFELLCLAAVTRASLSHAIRQMKRSALWQRTQGRSSQWFILIKGLEGAAGGDTLLLMENERQAVKVTLSQSHSVTPQFISVCLFMAHTHTQTHTHGTRGQIACLSCVFASERSY